MAESILGYIAFITSFIGLIPQIIKALKTKSTDDISMFMAVNYVVCSCAWIGYGAITDSIFVAMSNVVGLITSIGLILCKKYFDSDG